MTFTKVAVVGCLALLGLVCWLAASGLGAAREGLISLFALVLLVGGGNLLSGRFRSYGSYGRRGAQGAPDPAGPEPGDRATTSHDDRPAP